MSGTRHPAPKHPAPGTQHYSGDHCIRGHPGHLEKHNLSLIETSMFIKWTKKLNITYQMLTLLFFNARNGLNAFLDQFEGSASGTIWLMHSYTRHF